MAGVEAALGCVLGDPSSLAEGGRLSDRLEAFVASSAPSIVPSPGAPGEDLSITRQATRVGSTSVVVPLREDRYAPGVIVEQKYQLVRLLGEGGMGSVWVAKNLTLGVHVALKLMHSELATQLPGAAERMLQEARAAACIGHPAIVQVFDFGRTRDGEPYISMELLDGESLAAALKRRGRLPAVRALQVLLPIADALSMAHARGIVHRDLKPDNVLLAQFSDGRSQPKILDFGIAKLENTTSPKLTLDGTVLGSPAYMSPEQARGEAEIDHRADVWAFSVMIYELVTGRVPFRGDGYNALLWAIIGHPVPPLSAHGIDEPELWAILERGLKKDRNERFQSIRDLGRAVAKWLVARKVKTDITKAPLDAWLHDSARERFSVFSSLSPGSGSSDEPRAPSTLAPPDILVVPAASAVPETQRSPGLVLFDGLRVAALDAMQRLLSRPRPEAASPSPRLARTAPRARPARRPSWQWAVLAFLVLGAFVVAVSFRSGPEVEAARAAEPSPSAVPAAPVLDAYLKRPPQREEPTVDEPPVVEEAPAIAPAPKPERAVRVTRPRPARRAGSSAELKNPFR